MKIEAVAVDLQT